MQPLDGGGVVLLLQVKLHVHLPHGLVHRQNGHPGVGQRGNRLGQHSGNLDVAAYRRNHADLADADLGIRKALLQGGLDALDRLDVGAQVVGDGVGIEILVDDLSTESGDLFQKNLFVPGQVADHVLIEELDRVHALASCDDFHAGGSADVVAGDECAAVLRLKGILDAQADVALAKTLGGARVNRLHTQVGQLVRHVIVGTPDRHGVLNAHHARVGTAQVVLLVNDGFPGAGEHGNTAEDHLAVAAVKNLHQAALAVTVAGGDGQLAAHIHIGEGPHDVLIQ